MSGKSGAGIGDGASASVTARPESKSGAVIRGYCTMKCFDAEGNLKWEVKDHPNMIVNTGLDELLDCTLSNKTPENPYYVGLKDTGTPTAADTMASHASWAELTNYSGDRKSFGDNTVSGQSIVNATAASFSITGADDVYGCFLTNELSTSADLLFSVVDFASPRTVAVSDTLEVTYTISAADDGV